MLAACNNNYENGVKEEVTENPTPEEILSNDKHGDVFFMDGVVYTNAQDIEWVNEEELTMGEEIGEIKKQTDNHEEFENFTASILPVGTKIFEPEEKEGLIYIVKLDDEEIRYLGLVEG